MPWLVIGAFTYGACQDLFRALWKFLRSITKILGKSYRGLYSFVGPWYHRGCVASTFNWTYCLTLALVWRSLRAFGTRREGIAARTSGVFWVYQFLDNVWFSLADISLGVLCLFANVSMALCVARKFKMAQGSMPLRDSALSYSRSGYSSEKLGKLWDEANEYMDRAFPDT